MTAASRCGFCCSLLEKIIEILGMAVGEALSIWLIPDYMYYYLLDNVRGVWYFQFLYCGD